MGIERIYRHAQESLVTVNEIWRRGWGNFSTKTPDQVQMLKDRNSEYHTAELEAAAGPLERSAGMLLRDVIRKGREDPQNYERFKVHIERCTNENILTLVYGSLDDPADIDNPPETRKTLLFKVLQLPQGADMYPAQGLRCVFRGPAARAAFDPEQLKRVSETVWDETRKIVGDFSKAHPGREMKIRVFGFSTGTHDAAIVANRLGEELGTPIDKLTLVAPGMSIAKGEFAAWPASPSAEVLHEKGYTPETYHKAIYSYTQEANTKHWPTGENLEIHYGTHDTIIPPYQPGGTIDLINQLKKEGKAPTEIVYHGMDHVTMPGTIIWEMARGTSDPYCLRSKRTIFEYGFRERVTDAI